jgi:hypothetical protein
MLQALKFAARQLQHQQLCKIYLIQKLQLTWKTTSHTGDQPPSRCRRAAPSRPHSHPATAAAPSSRHAAVQLPRRPGQAAAPPAQPLPPHSPGQTAAAPPRPSHRRTAPPPSRCPGQTALPAQIRVQPLFFTRQDYNQNDFPPKSFDES